MKVGAGLVRIIFFPFFFLNMDECLFGGGELLPSQNKQIYTHFKQKAKHLKGMDKFVLEVSR